MEPVVLKQTVPKTDLPKPPSSKRSLKRSTQRKIFIITMLAYPLLQFFLFWGYVNVDTILLTFRSFSWSSGEYVFVGFQNYRTVINDILNQASTQRTLLNSLMYMPINSFVILPLSLFCSYFLYKKIPLSGFFRVVYFLPSILPIVVLTMTFGFIFDSNLGPVNSILHMMFRVPSADIPSWFGEYPTSQIMILVYCVWVGLGLNILLLSGAISRIPKELIEYGELEGITLSKELRHVVIPMIWPSITTIFLLGMTAVFTILLQPLLLTPDNPHTNIIALSIYNSVVRNGNLAYFATFGILLSIIGTPIIMLIRRGMSRLYTDVDY